MVILYSILVIVTIVSERMRENKLCITAFRANIEP
jgi:hypothetical protein